LFIIKKTDQEKEDEVAIYDSYSRKWTIKKVQVKRIIEKKGRLLLINTFNFIVKGFYYPEKRNGHVMCTGQLGNEFGVFMFGGYGHQRYYLSSLK
jgi:hypothetical protein